VVGEQADNRTQMNKDKDIADLRLWIEKLAIAKDAKSAKINNKLDHGGHGESQKQR